MKMLIFIHGPNGVGKSTTCARLFRRLPHASWLDSEWCRMINPFDLTPEIEALAERHISVLLRGYLECSLVEHVIFCYGLHGPRQRIYERVLRNLDDLSFHLLPITLNCSEEENIRRMRQDGRDVPGYIQRSLQARAVYEGLPYQVIDSTGLSVEETVDHILQLLQESQTTA
jgi:ribose 1,5-bisphosphokinase PhnN